MTVTSISLIDAKEEFTELVNRVVHNKDRIILTRRGKEVAALISLEDFHLLQSSQNESDLQEATEALKEARQQGTITLEALKAELDAQS